VKWWSWTHGLSWLRIRHTSYPTTYQNIRVWYTFTYTGCFRMRCRNPSRIMENISTGRVIYKVLSGMDGVSIVSYGIQCLRVLLEDQDNPLYKRDPLGVQGIEYHHIHTHHSLRSRSIRSQVAGRFCRVHLLSLYSVVFHINPI
jgi:hypothetical protein